MSDLSDYQTHVWNPLEKFLRATIAAQREEIYSLKNQLRRAVDGAQPLWSGDVRAMEILLRESRITLSEMITWYDPWAGKTANQEAAMTDAKALLATLARSLDK